MTKRRNAYCRRRSFTYSATALLRNEFSTNDWESIFVCLRLILLNTVAENEKLPRVRKLMMATRMGLGTAIVAAFMMDTRSFNAHRHKTTQTTKCLPQDSESGKRSGGHRLRNKPFP